jgi:hypothetical protein
MFFLVKGLVAVATNALQPEGWLCRPVMEDEVFSVFQFNGAPVEWNWQGKTEVLGGKTCPSATMSTTNLTWTDPGLRGESPTTNRLSHGTALVYYINLGRSFF